MKTLFGLFGLLCCPFTLHAQQVILDLDKGYPEDQFYFITYNDESTFALKANTTGYNKKSAAATWKLKIGAGGLGYVGFGYLHRIASNPFPDLSDARALSLWFNNTTPAAGAERVTFRFELHERDSETDANGKEGTQVWIYQSDRVLTQPPGWTQLVMPLAAMESLGEEGFAIQPGGFQGNGRFDMDKIKYWAVVLLTENQPVGTLIQGTTLFDYLTTVPLSVAADAGPEAPGATAFGPAYPNPFDAATTLTYTLQNAGRVSLRVFDVLGREVALLVNAPQEAGPHRVSLDGSRLAAGTYLCVLETDDARLTHVVTRVR